MRDSLCSNPNTSYCFITTQMDKDADGPSCQQPLFGALCRIASSLPFPHSRLSHTTYVFNDHMLITFTPAFLPSSLWALILYTQVHTSKLFTDVLGETQTQHATKQNPIIYGLVRPFIISHIVLIPRLLFWCIFLIVMLLFIYFYFMCWEFCLHAYMCIHEPTEAWRG